MDDAPTEIRDALSKMWGYELKTVARKLMQEHGREYAGWAGLKRDELRGRLLTVDASILRPRLNLGWWVKHEHRVYGGVSIIALIFSITIFFGPQASVTALLLDRLDELRVQVQELGDEKRRSTQVFGGDHRVLGTATTAAQLTELAQATNELKDLLAQLNTARGTEPLSEDDDLRIRLAEGTLAHV